MSKEYTRNYKFEILQAIGICLVVMGHTGVNIFSINNLFNYDSYHMPLFIFISGYFLNVEKLFTLDYVKKQFRHLIVPFFIFNIVCCAFSIAMHELFKISFCLPDGWSWFFVFDKLFIQPFRYGNFFWFFNDPTWFILVLFEVKMLNVVIRFFLEKLTLKNEFVILCIYFIISFITVSLSHDEKVTMAMQIVRPCYLLFFFQLGYAYKIFLEKRDIATTFSSFFIILLLEFVLVSLCLPNAPIADIWKGYFRNNAILTLFLAMNGIYFWLKVSDVVFINIAKNSIISYISRHTYAILLNHLICIFLFKIFITYICREFNIPGCDLNELRARQWYYPMPVGLREFSLFYFLAGLVGPLLLVYFYDRFVRSYVQQFLKKFLLIADIKQRLC